MGGGGRTPLIYPVLVPAVSQPVLSRRSVDDARRAVRAVLAAEVGLPQPAPVDWEAVDADAFLEAASVHRIASVLAPHGPDLGAPAPVTEALRRAHRDEALQGLRLASESGRAMACLRAAGVPALLFKGVALSAQTTGALTSRGSGDIDILVRPEDVPRAHVALEEQGWIGDPIPDAPRWWRHYLRVRRERTLLGPDSSIDLHWRVGWHAHPIPTAEILIARSVPLAVGGEPVPTLRLDDAFSVACYTTTVDRFARLRGLVDVVRLARRPDVTMPPGAAWRLRRVVGEAVALSDHVVGGLPADRRERWVVPGVDPTPLLAIWEHSSVRRGWVADDVDLAELIAIYRDSARFAGAPGALGMAVVDGLIPPERVPPGLGPVGAASVVGREVLDLVRTRLLRRT